MTLPIPWTAIKPLISIKPMFYIDAGCSYIISIPATGFYAIVTKSDPVNVDQQDFEDNYKNSGNQS